MITEMCRVELVCLSTVRSNIVQSVQKQGLLHMEDVPTELEAAPGFLSKVQLEGDEQELLIRLEDLARTFNEIVPLMSQSPSRDAIAAAGRQVDQWPQNQWDGKISAWAGRLRELTRERVSLQDNIDVLVNYQTILERVMPALGGPSVTLGKGSRALVLSGDVNRVVARLEERFEEEIGADCKFHHSRISRRDLVGLITFPDDKNDAVTRILNQEGISPVDMRDEAFVDASIGEIISKIESTLGKQRSQVSELHTKLDAYSAEIGAEVIALKAVLDDRLAQLHVQQQFAQSRMVTVIHGWTPSDKFGDLEAAVEKEFPGKASVNRLGMQEVEDTTVPTLLHNSKIFKPFEVVLSLFKPPTYGSLDPTVMVAVAFILFYGFILGDVVYGIAVIGFAKLLGKKWGHIEAVQSASTIGVYMGISAIIFGVIFGEYCGNLGEALHIPALFHRAHLVTELLIIAIMFGVIHVPLALAIGVRESLRHGHRAHAYEKFGMLLGLTAVGLGVCVQFKVLGVQDVLLIGGVPILLYIAALTFLAGVVFIFVGMGIMGLVGILEILSLCGNVLSYSRLMALGIASIALADIANELPSMMGYLIGLPMAFAVHLLNIGIGIASPTIHSLRLNFVEFLPKFYTPEGKSFSPFRKETQW